MGIDSSSTPLRLLPPAGGTGGLWSARRWQKLPHREAIVAHFRERSVPIHLRGLAPDFCFHPGVPPRGLALMVHGWSGNKLQWQPSVPETFHAGYDVCLLTLPGHHLVHPDERADASVPNRQTRAEYDVFCKQVLAILLASPRTVGSGFSLGATLLARVVREARRAGHTDIIDRLNLINPYLYPIGNFIQKPVPVSNVRLARTLLAVERRYERRLDEFLDHKEKTLRTESSPLYAFCRASLGAQLTTVELAFDMEGTMGELAGVDGRVLLSELDDRNDSPRTERLLGPLGWEVKKIPGARHTPLEAERDRFVTQVQTQLRSWHEEPSRRAATEHRSAS